MDNHRQRNNLNTIGTVYPFHATSYHSFLGVTTTTESAPYDTSKNHSVKQFIGHLAAAW